MVTSDGCLVDTGPTGTLGEVETRERERGAGLAVLGLNEQGFSIYAVGRGSSQSIMGRVEFSNIGVCLMGRVTFINFKFQSKYSG